MNKTLLWVVAIIIIVIGGWYWYSNQSDSDMQEASMEQVNASGEQPDAVLVVNEAIQGRWQSTDDAKSVRVFNADFTAEDVYDGESLWTGLWVAFDKMGAPEITFPLEDNTVYVQLTKRGTPEDTLTFKVTKLTDTELQLIYMDRGGALNYTRVQ